MEPDYKSLSSHFLFVSLGDKEEEEVAYQAISLSTYAVGKLSQQDVSNLEKITIAVSEMMIISSLSTSFS